MSPEAAALQRGRVTLVLPPDPSLVRIARLTASAVAAQADLTVDLVERVRIAVSEAMSLLVGADDAEPVTLHLDFVPGSVTVIAAGTPAPLGRDEIELAQLVLGAVGDELDLTGSVVRVVVSAADAS